MKIKQWMMYYSGWQNVKHVNYHICPKYEEISPENNSGDPSQAAQSELSYVFHTYAMPIMCSYVDRKFIIKILVHCILYFVCKQFLTQHYCNLKLYFSKTNTG